MATRREAVQRSMILFATVTLFPVRSAARPATLPSSCLYHRKRAPASAARRHVARSMRTLKLPRAFKLISRGHPALTTRAILHRQDRAPPLTVHTRGPIDSGDASLVRLLRAPGDAAPAAIDPQRVPSCFKFRRFTHSGCQTHARHQACFAVTQKLPAVRNAGDSTRIGCESRAWPAPQRLPSARVDARTQRCIAAATVTPTRALPPLRVALSTFALCSRLQRVTRTDSSSGGRATPLGGQAFADSDLPRVFRLLSQAARIHAVQLLHTRTQHLPLAPYHPTPNAPPAILFRHASLLLRRRNAP